MIWKLAWALRGLVNGTGFGGGGALSARPPIWGGGLYPHAPRFGGGGSIRTPPDLGGGGSIRTPPDLGGGGSIRTPPDLGGGLYPHAPRFGGGGALSARHPIWGGGLYPHAPRFGGGGALSARHPIWGGGGSIRTPPANPPTRIESPGASVTVALRTRCPSGFWQKAELTWGPTSPQSMPLVSPPGLRVSATLSSPRQRQQAPCYAPFADPSRGGSYLVQRHHPMPPHHLRVAAGLPQAEQRRGNGLLLLRAALVVPMQSLELPAAFQFAFGLWQKHATP